jgi:hypothetical protein
VRSNHYPRFATGRTASGIAIGGEPTDQSKDFRYLLF